MKLRPFREITADVKARVAGQWPRILADVAGLSAEVLDGRHHSCPKCGGTDRFRMIDVDAGAVFCNQCFSEKNGDGFAAVQWMLGIDFRQAVELIAEYLNVPSTNEPATKAKAKSPSKPVPISDGLQDGVIARWCESKPPITVEAVKVAGGVAVNWPPNYQGDARCISWPAVDDCGNITGHILRRVTGADFPAFGKMNARKTHMLKGSKDGLVIPGGWERVKSARIVWKVEGVPDALALFPHLPDDHAVITNICGAKPVPPYLAPLAGKIVFVVGDADQPGHDGVDRWSNKLAGITSEVRAVRLPYDVTADSGKDLRDFLCEGGTFADLLKLADEAGIWMPAAGARAERVDVKLSNDEFGINNAVVAALAGDEMIYQRGGQLVSVNQDMKPEVFTECSSDVPRIAPLPLPIVRERIAKAVCFYTGEGVDRKDKLVPDWCARAVHSRGQWEGIRPLQGIVNHPILKPDGSILCEPGYDPQTGLFLHWPGGKLPIAASPSKADALAAIGRLKNLVSDFPFETSAHLAGWLAFLLTPLVRHSFPYAITSPLFLIDANVRGSGKSKLADIVGLVVCGGELPRMVLPRDDDELRKSMLAIALAGDEIVLIDNVAGELGGQTLDATLTGTSIRGRVLSESRNAVVELCTVFAATANNAGITGDLCRRTIHVRLASPLEKPEERADFAIPNILRHVRQNRAEYLSDALMILRAFCVAGRPVMELPAMGSFEAWSSIVRSTLVWLGEADPWETRIEFAKQSDSAGQTLATILRTWERVDPEGDGLTVAELLLRLERHSISNAELASAVCDLCNCTTSAMPSPKMLGRRLGTIRDRVYQGRRLVSQPNRKEVMVWKVEHVNRLVPGLPGVAGFVPTPRGTSLDFDSEMEEKKSYGTGVPETRQHPANPAVVEGAA